MSAVRRKLNSQAGVAMVIALVFFLLCVMVGVVIVTAATVSAGSVALERQTWRETEALTSAAQLLADDVTGMSFTGAYTKTETVTTTVTQTGTDADGEPTYKTTVSEGTPTYTAGAGTGLTGGGILDEQLDALSELYYRNQGLTLSSDYITLALTFTAGAGGSTGEDAAESSIPDVECALTVAEDYTIKAVLKCGADDNKSTLTMVFQPQVSGPTAGTPVITTTNGTSSQSTKETKTTYTTTITWGDPVITKGATTS